MSPGGEPSPSIELKPTVAEGPTTITISPGAATAPQADTARESAPPIAAIRSLFPFLKGFFSLLVQTLLGLYRLLIYLTSRLVRPVLVLSPIPIILYILAPVFTFCQVLWEVGIVGPLKLLAYVLDAVYPVYVFVGVACITGCLLGLAARWVSARLVRIVVQEKNYTRRGADFLKPLA